MMTELTELTKKIMNEHNLSMEEARTIAEFRLKKMSQSTDFGIDPSVLNKFESEVSNLHKTSLSISYYPKIRFVFTRGKNAEEAIDNSLLDSDGWVYDFPVDNDIDIFNDDEERKNILNGYKNYKVPVRIEEIPEEKMKTFNVKIKVKPFSGTVRGVTAKQVEETIKMILEHIIVGNSVLYNCDMISLDCSVKAEEKC